MSSLGGSTVSSSYNRLLVLPSGGGDGSNLVPLTDGDNVTTFALRLSDNGIAVGAAQKIFLDGGGDTYLWQSSTNIMELWAGGASMLSLSASGGQKELVVNESNIDIDFRIESNDNTHALFVDAMTSWVGINDAGPNPKPQSYLHIRATDKNDPHILCQGSSVNGFRMLADRYELDGGNYGNDKETQLNLGVTHSSASSYLSSKVYGAPSVDHDSAGGWVSATDAGAYKGSSIVLDGGEGKIHFYAGDTSSTISKGAIRTQTNNVTVTSTGLALGGTFASVLLDVRGKRYYQGIGRTYIGSATIDSAGNIDLPSTNGPVFVVAPNVAGGSDNLDSITIDGATPEDGTRIWLMKTGTGAESIVIRTSSGSAADTDNAIQGVTNLCDTDVAAGNLDADIITQATIGSIYAVVPLMYRASTTDKWCLMDVSMCTDVDVA